MIFTRLSGGLGNQMFQYAAARALALRHGTQVALDAQYYTAHGGASRRQSQLDLFTLAHQPAPPLRSWLARRQRHTGMRWLRWLPTVPRWYRERSFAFDPRVETLPASTYLQGYFQSPRYFAAAADQIRTDFQFPALSERANIDLANLIQRGNTVAIHVRHGDYQTDADTNKFHGALTADYYQRALSTVRSMTNDVVCLIFADDPCSVANLNIAPPFQLITHNRGALAFRDMQLMSLCRYQIIANSSFSWWSAWLNAQPHKHIIAPRQWFRPGSARNPQDLLPAQWGTV